jgi:hypothetical protein
MFINTYIYIYTHTYTHTHPYHTQDKTTVVSLQIQNDRHAQKLVCMYACIYVCMCMVLCASVVCVPYVCTAALYIQKKCNDVYITNPH